jgi:hypothetical protein
MRRLIQPAVARDKNAYFYHKQHARNDAMNCD